MHVYSCMRVAQLCDTFCTQFVFYSLYIQKSRLIPTVTQTLKHKPRGPGSPIQFVNISLSHTLHHTLCHLTHICIARARVHTQTAERPSTGFDYGRKLIVIRLRIVLVCISSARPITYFSIVTTTHDSIYIHTNMIMMNAIANAEDDREKQE